MIAHPRIAHMALVSALTFSPLAIAKPVVEAPGDITAVTVYRGQALITRTLELAGPIGLQEIIITDLPAEIVAGSLYAEAAPGIEVRSLTYRQRPVSADVRDEVQIVDDKINALQQRMQENRKQREVLEHQSKYLDNLETFTTSTAIADINKGVLEADVIKDLSAYLFEQRDRIAEQSLTLDQDYHKLATQLDLLNRERAMITGSSSHTAREAVLYVDITDAVGGPVTVHYLVNNANWSPSYTARMDSEAGEMQLVYHASIEQRTGESWDDVAMSLSTATPALTARAPRLDQFTLSLTQMNQPVQLGAAVVEEQFRHLQQRKGTVDATRNSVMFATTAPPSSKDRRAGEIDLPWQRGQSSKEVLAVVDKELNDLAERIQVLEYTAGTAMGKNINPPTDNHVTESLTVTYTLPARITLASRTGQQLVTVRKMMLNAEQYRLATPVLTDFIYNESAARNTSDIVLLAGPLSSYLDGQFVGHSEMPSITAGEALTVGFGVNSTLRASREIVNVDEQIQGGNRVVEITYELTLENFNGNGVPVRLFDRIPVADDDEQVKVSLLSTTQPISDDAQYLDSLRDKGILRWDVEIPAGVSSAGMKTVSYTLRLEYDKQMSLASDDTDQSAG